MEILLLWAALSVGVGLLSRHRGRSFLDGFIWSLLLSPIVGLLMTLYLRPDCAAQEAHELEDGFHRKCPYCAEVIKAEARDLPLLHAKPRSVDATAPKRRDCLARLPNALEISGEHPTERSEEGCSSAAFPG